MHLISLSIILVILPEGPRQSSSIVAQELVKLAVVLCIMYLGLVLLLWWGCWCCSCWCSWSSLSWIQFLSAKAYMKLMSKAERKNALDGCVISEWNAVTASGRD